MTVGFSRQYGGEVDAVFLCASTPTGAGCNGDSGSGLTYGSIPVLVGIMDTGEIVSGEPCSGGSDNGFVNVAAPEIREFIEGSENPPIAPRGGGVTIHAVPKVGDMATCESGSWSGSPTFCVRLREQRKQRSAPVRWVGYLSVDQGKYRDGSIL
jgi:hypothetical protein